MAGVMVKLSKLSSLEGPNPTEVSGEKEEGVLPCDNLVSSGIRPLEGLGVSLSLRNVSMGHWGTLVLQHPVWVPLIPGCTKGSCSSRPSLPVSTCPIAVGQLCCCQRLLTESPWAKQPKCLAQIKN